MSTMVEIQLAMAIIQTTIGMEKGSTMDNGRDTNYDEMGKFESATSQPENHPKFDT